MICITVLRFLVGHLFLANGEFALRLLVVLGVRLQLLDGLVLEDRDAKFDVGLGIFVTGLSLSSVPGFPAWTRKKNLHRPWCRRVTRPASCSEPCASPRRCPRRTCRSLGNFDIPSVFPASHLGTGGFHHEQRTAVEQRIAREDDLVVAVLHEPADAVLGMAWRVQALDGDAPQLEAVTVGRRLRHAVALFSADDGELLVAELREL